MNVGGTGAACAVPPTSKAHSAGAAAAAGRSWVSTERPRWTTAAMMAPTIGAKTYNQASLRLPVTIIGPSARVGSEFAGQKKFGPPESASTTDIVWSACNVITVRVRKFPFESVTVVR